jgi:GNAT superfamily N-acetyltransferase
MLYREYNPDTDRQAIHAMFREIGWLKTEREEHVDYGMEAGPAVVADIDGRAEGIGTAAPGLMRYLHEDLDCWGVTAIATSPVARKQGLGLHLAARITAIAAEQGALLAALGMFEQGFYNRAGYGTMGYLHHVFFDPATLKTRVEPRVPRRLTPDDWEMIHAAQLKRMRSHGGFELLPATLTRAQLLEHEKSLGLGYCDGPNGEMTHGLWLNFDNAEYGPYYVHWLVYQNWDQFHELMARSGAADAHVRAADDSDAGSDQPALPTSKHQQRLAI